MVLLCLLNVPLSVKDKASSTISHSGTLLVTELNRSVLLTEWWNFVEYTIQISKELGSHLNALWHVELL